MKRLFLFVLTCVLAFYTCSNDSDSTSSDIGTAPTLSLPVNNATNQSTSPTLSWYANTEATSYTLQVSANSAFNSFVYNQSGLTNTSQALSGLNNLTLYYWRINAAYSYGTSSWSTIWSFTTGNGPCPGLQTVTYQGKTYNTVQIGSQCWLKENLDVGIMMQVSQNPTNNGIIEKYCYNNDLNNCNIYGGLYQWNEAMAYSTTPGTKGICPDGFHIPTFTELQTLALGSASNSLKAIGQGTGSGTGTNTSGFSALLAGYLNTIGYFYSLGSYAYFWSSTEYSSSYSSTLYLYDGNNIIRSFYGDKGNGFSIRCLKD